MQRIMERSKAREKFYHSKEWKRTREAYARSRFFLCERCLANGIASTGTIVHHKTHLTDANLNDTSISLDMSNLELLCIDCHNKEHFKNEYKKRYTVSNDGSIAPRD